MRAHIETTSHTVALDIGIDDGPIGNHLYDRKPFRVQQVNLTWHHLILHTAGEHPRIAVSPVRISLHARLTGSAIRKDGSTGVRRQFTKHHLAVEDYTSGPPEKIVSAQRFADALLDKSLAETPPWLIELILDQCHQPLVDARFDPIIDLLRSAADRNTPDNEERP